MPVELSRLYDLCADALTAVAAYYAAEGKFLPEKRFVSPGPPAHDCEMCAVYITDTGPIDGDVTTSLPEQITPSAPWGLRAATLVVEIVRCVSVPEETGGGIRLPSAAQLEADSLAVYSDAALTVNGLMAGVKDETLPRLHTVAPDRWELVGPEGGFVASRQTVLVGTHRARV